MCRTVLWGKNMSMFEFVKALYFPTTVIFAEEVGCFVFNVFVMLVLV